MRRGLERTQRISSKRFTAPAAQRIPPAQTSENVPVVATQNHSKGTGKPSATGKPFPTSPTPRTGIAVAWPPLGQWWDETIIMCHCLEQAAPYWQPTPGTTCSKQWHRLSRERRLAAAFLALLRPALRFVTALATGFLRIDLSAALRTTAALQLHNVIGARTGAHNDPHS